MVQITARAHRQTLGDPPQRHRRLRPQARRQSQLSTPGSSQPTRQREPFAQGLERAELLVVRGGGECNLPKPIGAKGSEIMD